MILGVAQGREDARSQGARHNSAALERSEKDVWMDGG